MKIFFSKRQREDVSHRRECNLSRDAWPGLFKLQTFFVTRINSRRNENSQIYRVKLGKTIFHSLMLHIVH